MAVIDISDAEKALEWLLPPEVEEDDKETDEETRERVKRIEILDSRLSGLFEDTNWVSPGQASTLKEYLSEWLLSDGEVAEFKSKVTSDEETFLGWLEGEVELWENGEKAAQQNPNADPSKAWSAWYKYDSGDQEYYYAGTQHADDWRTWDEWEEEYGGGEEREQEGEPPPAFEVHPGTGLELQRSGEYWLYENEWLTDEQLTVKVAPPPAYEVHTGTGLELQRSGEYWLYENEWLTDEQLTARVSGPAPAAEQAAESPEAVIDDFAAMLEEIPGIDQLSEDEIVKIIGEALSQTEG